MDGSHAQKDRSGSLLRLVPLITILFGMGPAPFVSAHDAPRKDVGKLTEEAELIFEGVVTKIDYGMSTKGDNPEDGPLPHTFVTYQINDAPKGRSAEGNTITLRFLGGPTPDGRFLVVSINPTFEVGERDLLFVRRNGESQCPLVGCGMGRLRIINNRVHTNDGVEMLAEPDGKISFGRKLKTPQTMSKRLGPAVFSLKKAPLAPEDGEKGKAQYRQAEQQFTPSGQPLDIQRVKLQIGEALKKRVSPQQLQSLQPVRSAKPGEPFKARSLAMKPAGQIKMPPTAMLVPTEPQSAADQQEVEMIMKNNGNPVLGGRPPATLLPPGGVIPQLPGRVAPRGDAPMPEQGGQAVPDNQSEQK